jgi:hypothetical protein
MRVDDNKNIPNLGYRDMQWPDKSEMMLNRVILHLLYS